MIWPFSQDQPIVETASLSDAPILARIHANAFTHRWSTEDFIQLLENDNVKAHHCRRPGTLFFPPSTRPRGFVLTRVAGDEAEILTIAVATDARKLGVGQALMRATMNDLYADRIPHLFLEVEERNNAAIALYKGLGFKQVGEREAYYQPVQRSGTEPPKRPRALVMRCELR